MTTLENKIIIKRVWTYTEESERIFKFSLTINTIKQTTFVTLQQKRDQLLDNHL